MNKEIKNWVVCCERQLDDEDLEFKAIATICGTYETAFTKMEDIAFGGLQELVEEWACEGETILSAKDYFIINKDEFSLTALNVEEDGDVLDTIKYYIEDVPAY